jgi:hypothetical protein
VLAYGRAALWRLTGATRITEQHGAVGMIEVGGRMVPLVASIHPASVMRTKIEAGWALVEAATARAVRYARGMPIDPTVMLPRFEWDHDGSLVRAIHMTAIRMGVHVAIDCEFDRDTKRPFMIGMSVDGVNVVTAMATPDALGAVRELCDDARVVKVMHHAPADVIALSTVAIDVRPPLWDTLLMYAACYPDLPVGLARVGLHLFDHVHEWKGMDARDPQYNAIDVALTWRAWVVLHDTMGVLEVDGVWTRELQHVGAICMAQEARGLAVDPVAQRVAVEERKAEAGEIVRRVKAGVDELFARRRKPYEDALAQAALQIAVAKEYVPASPCSVHPTFNGLRKPTTKPHEDCTCADVYTIATAMRLDVADARKQRDRAAAPIKRWQVSGFDPASNDHLRWLLYDKDGFALTPQKNPHTGRPTANADAIARLLALKKVQADTLIRDTLIDVKRFQHLEKMVSTFLLWDAKHGRASAGVDAQGIAHPEDRPFGTGTGRHAGGPDAGLDDKRYNRYAYSVLNLPEETREIYVPHAGEFAVNAVVVVTDVVDDADEDAA